MTTLDDVLIVDWDGNIRDKAWLLEKYGNLVLHSVPRNTPGYACRLEAIFEDLSGNATELVGLNAEDGSSATGVLIAWYWPDARSDSSIGPACGVPPQMKPNVGEYAPVKESGFAEFGMGGGAYYFLDRGEIGPHATWVYGSAIWSDVVLGIGMLPGTEHHHLNFQFSVRYEDGTVPPSPPPIPPPEEPEWQQRVLILLGEQVEILKRIEAKG